MRGVPAIAALYLAAVVCLGSAGAVKLGRPAHTVLALTQAGLPATRLAVRGMAAAELAVAMAAIAGPGPVPAILVGCSYLGFALFVGLALARQWPLSSCGCFAEPDSLPTKSHVAMNLAAAASAVWWAAAGPPRLLAALGGLPWHGAALLLVGLTVALLAYLVWTNPLNALGGRARR